MFLNVLSPYLLLNKVYQIFLSLVSIHTVAYPLYFHHFIHPFILIDNIIMLITKEITNYTTGKSHDVQEENLVPGALIEVQKQI